MQKCQLVMFKITIYFDNLTSSCEINVPFTGSLFDYFMKTAAVLLFKNPVHTVQKKFDHFTSGVLPVSSYKG